MRYDVLVFQYNFSNKALIEKCTGVKACLVVKSVAKTADLSDNALRSIVDATYVESDQAEKMKIYEEVSSAIEKARHH